MKIAVVSDTHCNRELLDKVLDWAVTRERVTSIYHLGDDYDDANHLADDEVDLVRVPGIYDPNYRDGSTPCKVSETVMGLRIVLVHAREKDLDANDVVVHDIILYGHTHRPELVLEDGRLFMNPGHLKSARDKNIDPSFGILDISETRAVASIYSIDFKVIQSLKLMRAESGLYKS